MCQEIKLCDPNNKKQKAFTNFINLKASSYIFYIRIKTDKFNTKLNNMSKPKLLILDDSNLVLTVLLNSVAQSSLYEAYTAKTYAQAKSLIDEHRFTAAILDLELPDAKNGEQVDYVISKNIPVIVLTGTFNEQLTKMVSNKAIIDYIVKDTMEDIHNAVCMAENLLLYSGKRALVVDDSKLARLQLNMHLSEIGFTVHEAESGEKALEIIKKDQEFDLITIDYEMPGMNGVTLLQQIKALQHNYPTLYFGVYGNDSKTLSIRFLKSGANDVFVKPLEKESFNIKVANAFTLIKKQEDLNQAEHVFNEYSRALETASNTTKADKDGTITEVSNAFCEMTGYSREELIGEPHNITRHPQTPKIIFKKMWDNILKGEVWNGLLQNLKKDGENFFSKLTIVPFLDVDGNVESFISFQDDVTELVHSQERLQDQFLTDSLTHLGNRNKLVNDLQEMDSPLLAIVHIKDFKHLNNFYGEDNGNKTLIKFSTKFLKYCYDNGYSVYRVGGVDFAMLKNTHVENRDEELSLVEHTLKDFENTALNIGDHDIHLTFNCGISFGDNKMNHADMALRIARRDKQLIVLFDESHKLSEEYKNNLMWTAKIKNALHDNRIVCFYQPIYNNKTGEIKKYEALVRLIDEDGEIVSPYYFLDIAKQSGLYSEITLRVIQLVFEQINKTVYDISINFTVDDIINNQTKNSLFSHLKDTQSQSNKVIVELVESSGIESYEQVRSFTKEIKSYGAKLAIDDFGTGYSNFEYLIKLDPDFIKIDGSLIKNIDKENDTLEVLKTIVAFAKSKSYDVIAEFVSTKEIQEVIEGLDIDYSQGYYFGEPSDSFVRTEV